MFRAFRFAARLGFSIEDRTLAAIYTLSPLAAALACERVRDEVEKLLLSPHPALFGTLLEAGLLDRYLLCRPAGELPFSRLALLPRKALLRWCAAAVVLKENGCIASVQDFLSALRLDNRTLRCSADAAALLEAPTPKSAVEWKRQLRYCGVETVRCSARVRDALRGGRSDRALSAVLRSGECFSIRHLAVDGDDLLALGLRGRALGDMLQFLLDYVIAFPANNTREILLNLARGTEE
jgi:tRNA nucleotidyltransferase (CCA-adding enzyme)